MLWDAGPVVVAHGVGVSPPQHFTGLAPPHLRVPVQSFVSLSGPDLGHLSSLLSNLTLSSLSTI